MGAREVCAGEGASGAASPVGGRRYIALVGRDEFAAARKAIPELSGVESFDDWLDEQEGAWIGLAHAGVDAITVEVRMAGFAAWCSMTGRAPALAALDEFAAVVGRYREKPEAPCQANLVMTGVSAAEDGASFGGDGASGCEDRCGTRAHVVDVSAAWVLEWCRCCKLEMGEASANEYASLWIEHLVA